MYFSFLNSHVSCLGASDQLKAYYLSVYGTSLQHVQKKRHDLNLLISNLKLGSIEEADLEMVNDDFNEWKYFCHKQNSYKAIKYEEIFHGNSRSIMISGPKGIGKTNFLQNCLYHWSNGLHWKDLNFIFYFEFNKFNKLENVTNMKQLIKKFYKNILNGYEISSFNATMLIIDGLDEFAYFEELVANKSSNTIPLITAINNAFSSENYKSVLCGNIASVMRYWGKFKGYKDAISMQVLGFNISGIKSFFEDLLLSKTLKTDLENIYTSSRNGEGLLSVPLYLKVACSTLLTLNIQSVKTMTELNTLIFLHFVLQNCKIKEPLQQLMQLNRQHILNACEVAFTLMSFGKVKVSQNELSLVLDENGFDPLGFVKKSIASQQYQFVHFILMKFCASVHLLFNVNLHEIVKNKRLRNCLPIISGFVHRKENSFLNLICELREPLHKPTFWLREIYGKKNLCCLCVGFYVYRLRSNVSLQ